MKNYVSEGDVISFAAPYARTSGQGAKVGNLFGVACNDVANGATGQFKTKGIFDLTCLGTDTTTVGAVLYWDDTNKRLTTTASANTRVGVALEAKANGPTVVRCLLDGRI
jgi:predicted RecA/RadA family phage recombinase